MTTKFGAKPLVNITRGKRDYIHSIDMIKAAPINPDDHAFRFRFSGLTKQPGLWVERKNADLTNSPTANLRVTGPHGNRCYDFISEDKTARLDRLPDFSFHYLPESFQISNGSISAPMCTKYSFWLQLTELMRFWGGELLPNRKWLTASISGIPVAMQPVPEDAVLHLTISSHKASLSVICYRTNYGARGEIMVVPDPF